jgi:hypothetical protein
MHLVFFLYDYLKTNKNDCRIENKHYERNWNTYKKLIDELLDVVNKGEKYFHLDDGTDYLKLTREKIVFTVYPFDSDIMTYQIYFDMNEFGNVYSYSQIQMLNFNSNPINSHFFKIENDKITSREIFLLEDVSEMYYQKRDGKIDDYRDIIESKIAEIENKIKEAMKVMLKICLGLV